MIKYHETHDYDELLSDLLLNEPALAYISEADIAVGVVASTVEKKKGGRISAIGAGYLSPWRRSTVRPLKNKPCVHVAGKLCNPYREAVGNLRRVLLVSAEMGDGTCGGC